MTTAASVPVATARAVLRATWIVARENYRPLTAITLIIGTPINLILMFFPLPDDATLQEWGRYLRIQNFLELWIGTVRLLAVTHITVAGYARMRLSAREAFDRSSRGYGSAIWAQILYSLAIVLGLLLLVVPGVFIAVAWFFSSQAIVVHRLSGWQALMHSRAMVAGRWWRFLGRFLVLGLIMIVCAFVATIPSMFAPHGFISEVVLMVPVDLVLTYFTVVFGMLYLMSVPPVVPEPATEPLRSDDGVAARRAPDLS